MTTPLHQTSARRPHPWDLGEIRFCAGIASQVLATLVTCVAGLSRIDGLGVLLVVTLATTVTLRPWAAAGLGLIGWALFTGFVTNSYAQLTFRHDDLRVLVLLLVMCPAAACLSGCVARRDRARQRR